VDDGMCLTIDYVRKELDNGKLEGQDESLNGSRMDAISRPRIISKMETVVDMMFSFNEMFCHRVVDKA